MSIDANYIGLPSYMWNRNYRVQFNNTDNVNLNASGLSATSGLQTAVANMQQMVDYNRKQINTNFISNFNQSPIQVLSPISLSNVVFGSSGTGTQSTLSFSSGTTALVLNATTNPTDVAVNFLAGPGYSSIMTLNTIGTLGLPFGASPHKYLECMDSLGTTQWNYVSNLTQGLGASLNVLGNNSFSFQQNLVENASLDPNGNMTAQNFFSVSDQRYKKNISTLVDAGHLLKQIRGVRFDWLKDGSSDIGVIAQEVFTVIPEAIVSSMNGSMLTVAYNKIIPLLIETIKDLQLRVEVLESKCAT